MGHAATARHRTAVGAPARRGARGAARRRAPGRGRGGVHDARDHLAREPEARRPRVRAHRRDRRGGRAGDVAPRARAAPPPPAAAGRAAGARRGEGGSLKTWLFHILANRARTRAVREARSVPFTALAGGEDAPAVDPDRFNGDDDAWPGHWAAPPRPWEDPERRLQSREARELLRAAIAGLPETQQAVLTLRDVE